MKSRTYLMLIAFALIFHGFWLAFGGLTPLPVRMAKVFNLQEGPKNHAAKVMPGYQTLHPHEAPACYHAAHRRQGFPPPPPASRQHIYDVVSVMPAFPGCVASGHNDMTRNLCTPKHLKDYGKVHLPQVYTARPEGLRTVPGKVYVSFVVERDGSLSQIQAQGAPYRSLERAAEDLFHQMNRKGMRWTPARSGGKTVRARMTMPVAFGK